ncbi:MAG: hypothetical protein IKJ01_03745 [Lachnospiraceae bacterium]|nr:hypothetical protein [Lachnospiraceae bacterium]
MDTNISIVAGVITAIATFVGTVISVYVIQHNKKKEKHILFLKFRSAYKWFEEAKKFCNCIFSAEEQRGAVQIYEECIKYKPKPNKDVLEIYDISQQYGHLFNKKNEDNLFLFAQSLRNFSYEFEFLINRFAEAQKNNNQYSMIEFKNTLKQIYPREEESSFRSVDEYILQEINKVKQAWKKVEIVFEKGKIDE